MDAQVSFLLFPLKNHSQLPRMVPSLQSYFIKVLQLAIYISAIQNIHIWAGTEFKVRIFSLSKWTTIEAINRTNLITFTKKEKTIEAINRTNLTTFTEKEITQT